MDMEWVGAMESGSMQPVSPLRKLLAVTLKTFPAVLRFSRCVEICAPKGLVLAVVNGNF